MIPRVGMKVKQKRSHFADRDQKPQSPASNHSHYTISGHFHLYIRILLYVLKFTVNAYGTLNIFDRLIF